MTVEEIYKYIWEEVEGYDLTWEPDCQRLAEKLYNDGWCKLKEGKWLFPIYAGGEYYRCSCCGKDYPLPPTWNTYDVKEYLNYCSCCGAKMSEEETK